MPEITIAEPRYADNTVDPDPATVQKRLQDMDFPHIGRLVNFIKDSQFGLGHIWEGTANDIIGVGRESIFTTLCLDLWDEYRADPDLFLTSKDVETALQRWQVEQQNKYVTTPVSPISWHGATLTVGYLTNTLTGSRIRVLTNPHLPAATGLLLTTAPQEFAPIPYWPFGILHTHNPTHYSKGR